MGAGVLTLDVLTKRLIEHLLLPGDSVVVWPGVFYLTRVSNPGAAFGLLPGSRLLLAALSSVVVIAIIRWGPVMLPDLPAISVALGLVAGGAAGNLVDRVVFGHVTDFLDFRIWPVFNLADVAIVVGVGLIVVILARTASDR